MDGAFLRGDSSEATHDFIADKAGEGEMVIPFQIGTVKEIYVLKVPGVKSRGYSALRPLKFPRSSPIDLLWILPEGIPMMSINSKPKSNRGVVISEKLFKQTRLTPEELVLFTDLMLSVDSLKKQLADIPGSPFPQMNAGSIQAGLQFLNDLAVQANSEKSLAQAA